MDTIQEVMRRNQCMYATFAEERKLWKKGFRVVAGIDEVGRGPLAGPVVACAVSLCGELSLPQTKLRDSKQLTAKWREQFYKVLTSHPGVRWGIGIVSEKIIDKINIYQATKLAMQKAVKDLKGKIDFLILDGNMLLEKISIPQKAIIKGDEKVFSCAAASIIAKVTHDRLMLRYHKKYPRYGFDRHKGYGTKLHFKMLKKHGPCPIHRKTFASLAEKYIF